MPIIPSYRKAARVQCKLSVSIEGLAGGGKSGLALAMAKAFAPWDKIYALDTENKSLDLFTNTKLHTGELVTEDLNIGTLLKEDGFKPSYYAAYRKLTIDSGGEVQIFDSLSHAWQYKGGILDMVSAVQAASRNPNKWAAWGDPAVVEEKAAIMDLVRSPYVHTISTIRSKEKSESGTDDQGKPIIISLGEQQIMMPDFKFEPDLVLAMVEPGVAEEDEIIAPAAKVLKSRYRILRKDETVRFTKEILDQMVRYLNEGTNPAELLELQRLDYIAGAKEFLDTHPAARQVWAILKEEMGLKDVKLPDMRLKDLKQLYGRVAAD